MTDSIADVPRELLDYYQIHQFPLQIKVNDSTYLDRITLQSEKIYEWMKYNQEPITWTQANRKNIENLYSFLNTYYDSIIVITVSKEMSGTYRAFQSVAQASTQKISVINSKGNSASQGLLVLKAAEAIDKGCTHDEVVQIIQETINRTEIYVSLDCLQGMIRSGRIHKTVGMIGNMVNFKPIVSIDQHGHGIILGKAFSTESNTKQILQRIKHIHETDGIERYAIVHGNGESRLLDFQNQLVSITGKQPVFIEKISAIVASNSGQNTIAVALIRNNPSKESHSADK